MNTNTIRLTIIIGLLLIGMQMVEGACFTPTNGLSINVNETMTLCTGNYEINGTGSGASNKCAAIVINASNLVFDCNNSVINGPDQHANYFGICLKNNYNITIQNCILNGYNSSLMAIENSHNERNLVILNSIFRNSNQGSYIGGVNNTYINNVTFINTSHSHGLYLDAVTSRTTNYTVINSFFINNAGVGIKTSSTAALLSGVNISNNVFTGNGYVRRMWAIETQGGINGTIFNNTIYENLNGILLTNAPGGNSTNWNIFGNTLYNNNDSDATRDFDLGTAYYGTYNNFYNNTFPTGIAYISVGNTGANNNTFYETTTNHLMVMFSNAETVIFNYSGYKNFVAHNNTINITAVSTFADIYRPSINQYITANFVTFNVTPANSIQVLDGGCDTIPIDETVFGTSITLCSGNYSVSDSGTNGVLRFNANQITLNCNNTILSGSGYGVDTNFKKNITVNGCRFNYYSRGIYSRNTQDAVYSNNYFYNITDAGIYGDRVFQINVTNNYFLGGSNITTTDTYGNRMATFGDGVAYSYTSKYNFSNIINNTFELLNRGVYLGGFITNVSIFNNRFIAIGSTGYAIKVHNSSNDGTLIYNNYFRDAGWDTIATYSNYTSIYNNNFDGWYHHAIDTLADAENNGTTWTYFNKVYNNTFNDTSLPDPSFQYLSQAIFFRGVANSNVYNNTVYNSNIDTQGQCIQTHDNTFEYNTINLSSGLIINGSALQMSSPSIFRNNIIMATGEYRLFTSGASTYNRSCANNIQMYNNKVIGTLEDGYLIDGIFNLTIYNHSSKIHLENPFYYNVYFDYSGSKNLSIANNTLQIYNSLPSYPYNDVYNVSTSSVLSYNIDNYSISLQSGQQIVIGDYSILDWAADATPTRSQTALSIKAHATRTPNANMTLVVTKNGAPYLQTTTENTTDFDQTLSGLGIGTYVMQIQSPYDRYTEYTAARTIVIQPGAESIAACTGGDPFGMGKLLGIFSIIGIVAIVGAIAATGILWNKGRKMRKMMTIITLTIIGIYIGGYIIQTILTAMSTC